MSEIQGLVVVLGFIRIWSCDELVPQITLDGGTLREKNIQREEKARWVADLYPGQRVMMLRG